MACRILVSALVLVFVANLCTAAPSSSLLDDDSEKLLIDHIGQILTDQSDSKNVQIVTNMKVNTAETYGHGVKVNADVDIAYTDCIRDTRYDVKDCKVDSNLGTKHCSLTAIMVQPQGGRKWYKVSDVKC